MTVRRVLATSGGFLPTDRWEVATPGPILAELLRLTGKTRPRLLVVLTASGDDRAALAGVYGAFRGWGVDVQHLELFPQPNADPAALVLGSDAVWVGGGSVANLLAVWRRHGLDTVFREAWDAGVVLGGVSAGSICWHQGGTTDSFGPELRAVTDGLALLPYGNGVHHDSEEQRRPKLHQLVSDGTFESAYATDDGVGVLYEGIEPVRVVSDRPESPAAAYRVELVGGSAVETRLSPGSL